MIFLKFFKHVYPSLTNSKSLFFTSQDLRRFASSVPFVFSPLDDVATGEQARNQNRRLRIDLAAAFRELDRLNFNEAIDNHLSVMAPAADGSGKQIMLINRFGMFWNKVPIMRYSMFYTCSVFFGTTPVLICIHILYAYTYQFVPAKRFHDTLNNVMFCEVFKLFLRDATPGFTELSQHEPLSNNQNILLASHYAYKRIYIYIYIYIYI